RKLDLSASKKFKIPLILLMENAAAAIAREIINYIITNKIKAPKILIVAGPGNNGGDGIVVGRHLLASLQQISITLIIIKNKSYQGDALINYEIIKQIAKTDNRIQIVENKLSAISNYKFDIVVDAIFGTGFKGMPTGIYQQAIQVINKLPAYKIAIDIASGVNGDNGEVLGDAVCAHCTVTMGLLKTGLLLFPAQKYCGKIKIANLGINYTSLFQGNTFLLDPAFIKENLPLRKPNSHKGNFGSVLVVAGGDGYSGAACLTSVGALVSGAGIVRLAYPENIKPAVEKKLTEVIKISLPSTQDGSIALSALHKIKSLVFNSTVFAIGPGLTTNQETKTLTQQLIPSIRLPMVIDADGLNNITTDLLLKIPRLQRTKIIITPHPGEFERLFGIKTSIVNQNRIEICRKYAQNFSLHIVLKGTPTVIGTPTGNIYINPTGNSGLAKGGSGDVLTGMIAGFLAQGVKPEIAACLGVYLHGLSADIAVKKKTEYSLLATDLIKTLPQAISEILTKNERIELSQ
ncbi:MAG: NAD(P)H-hydrate dehydratase, partial [candidate division WOR-3 bacterium]